MAHRRLVAAGCAGLAVAAALTALRPPDPQTRPVVVAAHDVESGTTLTDDDIQVREVAARDIAAHAYSDPESVVGQTAAAPMRRGENVTDRRLLGPDLLAGYPEGSTLATVRIADPQSMWGVEVGAYVDVVGVDPEGKASGGVLAADAQVVAIPTVDDEDQTGVTSGAVVVVSVSEKTAVELTDASTRLQLGLVMSDPDDVPAAE